MSILDKALLSISPEELGVINNRWRGFGQHDDGSGKDYSQLALQVVLGMVALLLLALLWNARLRLQIRQRQRAERALNDQLAFMRAPAQRHPTPCTYVTARPACKAAITAIWKPCRPAPTKSSANSWTAACLPTKSKPGRSRPTT